MRKFLAILMAAVVGLTLSLGGISEAKGSSGGRTSGYSRSAAPKASTSKASAPKSNTNGYKKSAPAASPSKGNTNGYKPKSSAAPSKGDSYTTSGGGKVTSAGGNTSGYKSKQTQTKEKAQENMAKSTPSSSNGDSNWYGGTNNHYYGSGYSSGFGHFASGMLFGSLLSSPWHVYAGMPGYVGAYGAAGYAEPVGGFYSPFTGILGVIIWLLEWAIIFGLAVLAFLYIRKYWRKRRDKA